MEGGAVRLKRAKGIEDILKEVHEADLVLTAEPSLATALNRMAGPRMGKLAYTPRQLARKYALRNLGQHLLEPHQEVIALADLLGCDVRESDNMVRRLSLVSRRSSDPEADVVRRGLMGASEALFSLPTLARSMRVMGADWSRQMELAVVGEDRFDNLDRLLLPESYTSVDPFEDIEVPIGEFHRFTNREQLIGWMASGIDRGNADSVAIVISFDSPYLNMVRDALVRKGVPVSITMTLDQDRAARAYLDLVDLALCLDGHTAEELSHLMAHIGMEYACKDPVLLTTLLPEERPGPDWLWHVQECTFQDTVEGLGCISVPDALRALLSDMGLLSRTVTSERLSDLRYMFSRTDVKVSTERDGVVILDCGSSVYVDRPIVISIGLDESWDPRDEENLDPSEAGRRAMDALSILMQQGEHRFRLVVDEVGGSPIRPSSLITSISGAMSFKDLSGKDIWFPSDGSLEGEVETDTSIPMDPGPLSSTELNLFLSCPSCYMFSRLVGTRRNPQMHKGTVVHWMAEVLAERPDIPSDALVNAAMGQLTWMIPHLSMDIVRTEMVLAERGLRTFLSSVEMEGINAGDNVADRRPNPIADELGLVLRDPNVERRFVNEVLGIKGVMDLTPSRDMVVDHKTGRRRGGRRLAQSMTPAVMGDLVDVQALVYLAHLRNQNPDGVVSMVYDHCLDDIERILLGRRGGAVVKVRCMPETMGECMSKAHFWNLLGGSKEKRTAIQEAGVDLLSRLAAESPPGPAIRAADDEEDDPFVMALNRTVADPEIILSAIKDLRLGKGSERDVLTIFKDDLDDVISLAADSRELIAGYWPTGFPAEPRSRRTCENCRFRDLCPDEVVS